MLQYSFTNSGNVIDVITDGVDKTIENQTIMQVKYNGKVGINDSAVPTATQILFGMKLNALNTTKAALVALATLVSWGLKVKIVGVTGAAENTTVLV
jgi:hypothetical protein